MTPTNLGDRVRIAAEPSSPTLTVKAMYIEGGVMFASCEWRKGVLEVACRVAGLELVGSGKGVG